jgi:hypothetical protein
VGQTAAHIHGPGAPNVAAAVLTALPTGASPPPPGSGCTLNPLYRFPDRRQFEPGGDVRLLAGL